MIKGFLLAALLLATGTHAWAASLGTDTDTNAHPDIVLIKCPDGVTTVSGSRCSPSNPLSVAPAPTPPNGALTIAASIGTTSTPIVIGGVPSHYLFVQNNSTGTNAPKLWCNPKGVAVAGSGVGIPPYGGGFIWPSGLTTVPNCVSDNGTASASGEAD